MLCDKNMAAHAPAKRSYPWIEVTTDPCAILKSPNVDAIAVITPVWTHYELAKAALEHGKHVFVEKPFTSTSAQASELIELAARKNLKIMVDHTFLFTGAVRKIRELNDNGALGDLYYYDSWREDPWVFFPCCCALLDLSPPVSFLMDPMFKGCTSALY